jgi:hypothetical protein
MGMKMRTRKILKIGAAIVLAGAILAGAVVVHYMVERKYHLWLPAYLFDGRADEPVPPGQVIDIMLMLGDHYEPHVGFPEDAVAEARVREWCERYPRMASRHRDSDGRPPQHTFFYPYDQIHLGLLHQLSDLCYRGFGEIELHLHHLNDTAPSVAEKFKDAQVQYSKVGALVFPGDPLTRRFGFVHGNWALDNSVLLPNGQNRCGVDNELQVLREMGCYADFTFPAVNSDGQPKRINRIYYATDDPDRPKSYNTGEDVRVGGQPTGDLLIVHGILGINWKDRRHGLRPAYDDGSITNIFPGDPVRVDYWVDTAIHVQGRPEWIFVKLYTHGNSFADKEANLGEAADRMYDYLESHYNDGVRYRLHYVTAREFYNIVKAAEAGKEGNPNEYRDFEIPKPLNRRLYCSRLYDALAFGENYLDLAWPDSGWVDLSASQGYFHGVEGGLNRLTYRADPERGVAEWTLVGATEPVQLEVELPGEGLEVAGASVEFLAAGLLPGSGRYRLTSLPEPDSTTQTIQARWTVASVSKTD